MNDGVLAVLYLSFLIWLFIGISILADIFMEAIEQITSKSELVSIVDSDGNTIHVEKMFWNPTIANLTLMALGSSAPEIILSVADTMGTLGEIPSELGPQAIVGSASFNLLVISAVSILAVEDVKKINMVGVFATTAIFSSWAYVWFFLVLVVISPGYVELWEACVTLGFMAALCLIAFSCDKCHSSGESKEEKRMEEKRLVAKTAIRLLQKKFGTKALLEVGQGIKPTLARNVVMSDADIDNINQNYSILLTKDLTQLADPENWNDPKEASVDELLDCLGSDNAVERIAYRREVAGAGNKDFLKLNKGDKGQNFIIKEETDKNSNTVSFKHSRYEVSESNGHVLITL